MLRVLFQSLLSVTVPLTSGSSCRFLEASESEEGVPKGTQGKEGKKVISETSEVTSKYFVRDWALAWVRASEEHLLSACCSLVAMWVHKLMSFS